MPNRLIQGSFTGGELAPSLRARVDLVKYSTGAATMRNMFPHVHGGVSNRPGLMYVGDVANHGVRGRLIGFSFNTDQTYVLEFGHYTLRIVSDGGYVVYPAGHAQAGQVVQIASPYAAGHLPSLKFAQAADVMTLCHPGYPPYQLGRYAHHDWRFNAISFVPDIVPPDAVNTPTVARASQYDKPQFDIVGYAVTAVKATTLEESAPAYSPDVEVATDAHVDVTWAAVPGATRYNIYRKSQGLYGYLTSTEATSFRDTQKRTPDLRDTPPEHRNPFNGAGNYPSCVAYFEQRMVFAGSQNDPQTLWLTRSGHYRSMSVSSPTKDDDAITRTLAGGSVDAIRSFAPLKDLIALTSGGSWTISSGGNADAITPSSMQAVPQNRRGASHLPPLIIGNTVLFVQDKGSVVRDLGYDFGSDSYQDTDLSLMSNHLFYGRSLVEWAYAAIPDSVVWCVRDDGVLLSMTYLREHEVFAWARHDTDGFVESVCTVSEGAEDGVYVLVRRTVGGQVRRYVERLASRVVRDVREAFFVDCGLTYRGSPVTSLSGLSHLEGKTVSILADGNVAPAQVVTGGRVSIDHPASVIHVGLPYVSELETLEPEPTQPTIQGRKKRVTSVTLRLDSSRGGWIGPDRSRLDELKQRSTEPMGQATRLHTGDITITLPGAWNTQGSVVIQQREPLPITVLAVIPEIEIGG